MRHLGLIIGVNQYQDRTFQPLQFAENDARALAQWLVNAKGGKWSPPDVQLAQGSHVTRELVESLLTQVCINTPDPDDVLVLYFAGHAFVDEKSGEGYLALANTQYQNAANSGLSLRTLLQQYLARSRAGQILCILDCFQTGSVWQMRRTSPYDSKPLLGQNILTTIQQQQNRLFLCSCRGNDAVAEGGERQLGAFAHGLILGLCGPAREKASGNITLPKLHAYLFNTLGEQQRPQLFGQQNPPLVIVGDLETSGGQVQAPQGTPMPAPVGGSLPGSGGGGLLRRQTATQVATPMQTPIQTPMQAPPVTGPRVTGNLFTAAVPDERKQQSQQLISQAQQMLQNQNFGPAFDLVEKALQIVPDDTEALTLKAQLLGTAGRFAEAQNIIEQIVQREPDNALIWSMRAVVLSNMGQHQLALSAIERSLELDAQNPETYGIKTTIMANMAAAQAEARGSSNAPASPFNTRAFAEKQVPVRENARSFFIGTGLHLLGLLCGIVGCVFLFTPALPSPAGLLIASFGLALLCVNATRGAFRYGVSRLVVSIASMVLIGIVLGGGYKVAYPRIENWVLADATRRLIPVLFMIVWLGVAAVLPFLLGLVALVAGLANRSRRKS